MATEMVGGGGVAVVLSAANAGTAGAVLASRRPRHPVGWLLLTFGLGQLLGRDSSLVVAAAASRAWWTAASAVAATIAAFSGGSKASGPPSGWSTCRCMRRG